MNEHHDPPSGPASDVPPPLPPQPPARPPMAVAPVVPHPERPRTADHWPPALGIICAVVGGLGILMYFVCSPVSLLFQGTMEGLVQDMNAANPNMPSQDAAFAAARQGQPYAIALAVASGALAVALLIGGIKLTKQKSIGWTILVWWAAIRIVVAVGNSFFDWYMFQKQMEVTNEQLAQFGGGNAPGWIDAVISGGGILGLLVGLVFRLGLPVIVLFFLLRESGRPPRDNTTAAPTPDAAIH